jgi:hypothetical protein
MEKITQCYSQQPGASKKILKPQKRKVKKELDIEKRAGL